MHDKKCVKCAKGNYGGGEGEEPKEAATLKYEVAPVQSDGCEEGRDGVDDDEPDGGGPSGLAVGHVPCVAEHRVVEHLHNNARRFLIGPSHVQYQKENQPSANCCWPVHHFHFSN